MTENVSIDPNYGMFKIGKCEHTMFSSGDIFCSLTPKELEAERQAARELREKWEELCLIEKSSKMSLMDFYKEWVKWSKKEEEYEIWLARIQRHDDEWKESWSEYKYRMDSYDKEKATAKKIELWRKYHMVADHLWIGALLVIAYLAWNDPANQFWAYVAGIFAALNIFMVSFRWKTYFQKDEWEVI